MPAAPCIYFCASPVKMTRCTLRTGCSTRWGLAWLQEERLGLKAKVGCDGAMRRAGQRMSVAWNGFPHFLRINTRRLARVGDLSDGGSPLELESGAMTNFRGKRLALVLAGSMGAGLMAAA